LIKIFNNGTVEQYNYKELYELIEYTIKLHKEELLKQQTPLPVVKTPVKEPPVATQNETSSESEIEEIIVKPKKKPKKKKKEVKEKVISDKKKITTIVSDDEPETESEVENTVESVDTHTEKLTANKQKSNDLMSVAMELQKQRESLDDTTSNNQKITTRMGPI